MTVSLDFTSCFAVTEAHLQRALEPAASLTDSSPRERVWALIDRMIAVAKPKQGAAKILLVLGRMAGADWIDGRLEVRVRRGPSGVGVVIEVLVDDGLSVTRLRPPMRVGVPFGELVGAIELHEDMVSPLVPESVSAEMLVLRASLDELGPSSGTMDVIVGDVLRGRAPPTPADAAPPSVRPETKAGTGPKSVRPGPKSVRPGPKSVKPPPKPAAAEGGATQARPIVPPPPAAARVVTAPRLPAPSDINVTVRKAAGPTPRPAARAPGANVNATIKVDAVYIPKEALREPRKPLPVPVRITESAKGGKPIPRDEEE